MFYFLPAAPRLGENSEQLFGLLSQAAGKYQEERSALELLAWLSAPWYNNPNNSSGNPEAPGNKNPKPDVCLGSP